MAMTGIWIYRRRRFLLSYVSLWTVFWRMRGDDPPGSSLPEAEETPRCVGSPLEGDMWEEEAERM
jgi:hypothetical protein